MKYIQFDFNKHKNPADLVNRCIESGAKSVLLEESKIPDKFFDLSSGLFGELLHKLSIYHIKLAIVVSDPDTYSKSFQSFLNEANQGNTIHSFSSRQSAINWLEKTE